MCRVGLVQTESSTDQCLALVKNRSAAVNDHVDVVVTARVECTGGQAAACAQYKEKLDNDKKTDSGSFQVPEPNEPETTPTDQPSPPSESDRLVRVRRDDVVLGTRTDGRRGGFRRRAVALSG